MTSAGRTSRRSSAQRRGRTAADPHRPAPTSSYARCDGCRGPGHCRAERKICRTRVGHRQSTSREVMPRRPSRRPPRRGAGRSADRPRVSASSSSTRSRRTRGRAGVDDASTTARDCGAVCARANASSTPAQTRVRRGLVLDEDALSRGLSALRAGARRRGTSRWSAPASPRARCSAGCRTRVRRTGGTARRDPVRGSRAHSRTTRWVPGGVGRRLCPTALEALLRLDVRPHWSSACPSASSGRPSRRRRCAPGPAGREQRVREGRFRRCGGRPQRPAVCGDP
jgi:hypothetical protein